jgi:hypothetical protein
MTDVLDPIGAPARERLRAEHDALAEALAVRTSIDWARRAFYELFFGLVSVGLTVKLAWDRYGTVRPGAVRKPFTGPPLFLWIAGAVTIVLLVLAIRSFAKARSLGRTEDAKWARYRELRTALGLDT